MSIYPQIGSGTLGSPYGLAERIRDLERIVRSGNAVRTEIGPGGITGNLIGANAIVASHIEAGTINSDHIETLSINAGHMQANSITVANAALSNLVVTTAKIADGAILTAKIGDAQITSAKIGNLQVQTGHIQDAQITSAKIGDAQITNAKILDGTIQTAKIGDAQITNAKIANLAADKITSGFISTDRFEATQAFADTLLSRLIHASGIVATTGLSAVSANMGTLTSGKIIVGSAGAQKTAIGSNISTSAGTKSGIVGTNASNVITFHLDNTTGDLVLKGSILTGSTGLGNLDGKLYGSTDPLFVSNPSGGYALNVDAITVRELNVTTLSAITADMGTITGGRISGGTIDGNVVDAGSITAQKLNVAFGGANLVRYAQMRPTEVGTGASSWGVGGGTLAASATKLVGEGSAQATYTNAGGYPHSYIIAQGAGSGVSVEPGQKITMSYYVKALDAWGADAGVYVVFYTSADIHIGEQAVYGQYVSLPDGWRRYYGTVTVPPNTAYPSSTCYIVRPLLIVLSPTTVGHRFVFNGVKIEKGELASGWVAHNDDLTTNSITETQITPGAITTGKLSADAIDGKTITGATVRTAASGARLEMTTSGLLSYDASGNVPMSLTPENGLDILLDGAFAVPARRLRWRTSGGSLRGDIATADLSGQIEILMEATGSGGSGGAQARIRAVDGGGSPAQFGVFKRASDGYAVIELQAGAFGAKRLLASDGTSDWLRLVGTAAHRISYGSTTVSVTASRSGTVTVAHGLGTTPTTIIVNARVAQYNATKLNIDGTNFDASVNHIDGAALTTSVVVDWIAIG